MLRIDINLLFTVINLVILVVVLRFVLFKRVHKIIEERQKLVDQSLNDAAEAKAAAEAMEAEHRDKIEALEQEKKDILIETKQKAAGEYERLVKEAERKAEGIVRSAKAAGEREKEEIIDRAQTEIAQMVVNAAAKLVLSPDGDESELYDEFLARAEERHE